MNWISFQMGVFFLIANFLQFISRNSSHFAGSLWPWFGRLRYSPFNKCLFYFIFIIFIFFFVVSAWHFPLSLWAAIISLVSPRSGFISCESFPLGHLSFSPVGKSNLTTTFKKTLLDPRFTIHLVIPGLHDLGAVHTSVAIFIHSIRTAMMLKRTLHFPSQSTVPLWQA